MSRGQNVTATVKGRHLKLSNLDKVLYPEGGFTKGEVLDYYSRIGKVMLPHIQSRAVTLKRYPDGVDGQSFYEKNAPIHTPEWVDRAAIPRTERGKETGTIDYIVIRDMASLIWAANLAALEFHVPMWTVDDEGRSQDADLVVFDLDPGPPATIVECCQVAQLIRSKLDEAGMACQAKTSGGKGLQLYVPIRPAPGETTRAFAQQMAHELAELHPDRIVARMTKSARPGKVFIDWSQNNPAKNTVAAYSLRARTEPTVSTPVTWDEVEACRKPSDLMFLAPDVLNRVEEYGDLFASPEKQRKNLPTL